MTSVNFMASKILCNYAASSIIQKKNPKEGNPGLF